MGTLFMKLLDMSITASWIVLAIVLLRFLLKKSPRWLLCSLWGFVGLRLVLPFSFESIFSLIPSKNYSEYTTPSEPIKFDTELLPQKEAEVVFDVIGGNAGPTAEIRAPSPDLQSFITSILSAVWIIGMVALLVYALVSWLKLRKTVSESVCIGENIYICDRIDSPFILGVFAPKIYLPSSMDKETAVHVTAHEKAHLKRFDHLWKPLGYLLLTVYWFNPLIWVAYILLCRDIELACDEAVIKNMSAESKKSYSEALLSCSMNRKKITACPLAFGEVGVKERIYKVLSYKKPAFWMIILGVIACVVLAVCFMTDPKEVSHEIVGSDFSIVDNVVGYGDKHQKFSITADLYLYSYDSSAEKWEKLGLLKKDDLTDEDIEASLVEFVDIDEVADSYYLLFGNVYYVVFKTVKGETFLGRGLAIDAVEELYLIKPELGIRDDNYITDHDFFNRSLRVVAGEAVSVFNFSFMDDFLVVGFTSGTDSYSEFQNDMGYAIFTMHDDGYLLREWHVYDDAALVTNGIFLCPDPAVLSLDGKMTDKNTYDVILCSNSDVASIERTVRNVGAAEKKISVPVLGQRTMTLFRWADDKTSAGSSVSLRFYDSDGNELTWNNLLPGDISDSSEDIRAFSGRSNCLVYAYGPGTPLEDIKNSVNWLKLAMDETHPTPFDIYCGDKEIYGFYYLYDAETLESVQFPMPSGLEPQTYILQNAVRGKDYLVLFRANPYGTGADENIYAFGITFPEIEVITDPFAESNSPVTWLKNVSVDDISSATAKFDGGDGFDFKIRMLRSLVEALNSVPDHAVYMGRGVPYKTSVTVECGARTYTLGYGGGLVEISFDKMTDVLYPDGIWQINDPNLASWFENLIKNGPDAAGENDPLDFAVDFIRDFYSFYGNDEIPEMDFSEYTDNEYLEKTMEFYREKEIKSNYERYKDRNVIYESNARYLAGLTDERLYISVSLTVKFYEGRRYSESGGSTFYLAVKETDKGYIITAFDFNSSPHYIEKLYRYGAFGYFPIDDWEKNGEKYLSIIKGETELISEVELGKQLLAEFEANVDDHKEKYRIVSVEDIAGSYDGYYMKTVSEVNTLCDQIAAQTKSGGVILVFTTGRYVAVVDGLIFDPLILDGTITVDEKYWDYELHRSLEYFNAGGLNESYCGIADVLYIVALD